MSKQQSDGDERTSKQQAERNPTADQLGAFRDDSKQAAAETLIEGSLESRFAAERYSVDSTFEILAQPGQRYVLTYLLQSEGPVQLGDLVDYAATQTDAKVDSNFRKEITIELTHTVLPKLDEFGFIEYDMEQQVVEPTEQTPVVEPYLRLALAQQDRAAEIHRR